jgi:hypothetical protein
MSRSMRKESPGRYRLNKQSGTQEIPHPHTVGVTSAAVPPTWPSVTKSVSSTVPKYSGEPDVSAFK